MSLSADAPPPPNAAEKSDAGHAARGAVWQTLTMIGQGLLPLHRVLVSRLFGQTIFGTYRMAADLVELLARTGMVASDKGLLRFLAEDRVANDRAGAARTAGSGLRLATVGGVILTLALAVAAPYLAVVWRSPALGAMLPIMAPAVAGADLAVVLVAATLAAKVTRVNLLVRGIGEPFLLVGLTLIAYAVGSGAAGLARAYAGAYLALAVVAATAAAALYGGRWLLAAFRGAPRREGFYRYVFPLAVAELANALLQRAHVFLLGALAGPTTVALFAAAEELGRPAAAVRYVFDPIATVAIAESFRLGDRARLQYNVGLITRWVASAAAPIAATLLVLRRELLSFYGPGYGSAAGAMVLMVTVHLSNAVLGIVAGLLPLSGRPGRFLASNLAAAALNVALCLPLIPRLGVMGAAIASLASTLFLLGTLIVQSIRLERVHPFDRALAKPFVAAAVAAVAELAIRRLPVPVPVRIAAVIAGGATVYGMVLLALGPGDEERRIIFRLLRSLGLRRSGSDRADGS
jgi:O-antigen/teichoic acid export membrane protein